MASFHFTIMSRAHADAESRRNILPGFPSLASFIATDPDRTTFIYNRFDELSARNLLYIQSELAELQSRQRKLDEEDATSRNMENKQCARNFASFEKAALQDGNEKQKEQMSLVLKIRKTIKEYQETLILASTLAALPSPSKTTLRAFRTEFLNEWPDKAQSFPTLGGSSANLYENATELVALKVQPNEDRLSKLVQDHLGFMFPDRSRSHAGIAYASGRAIGTFVVWFSTLLAALLLIGAIVLLYYVQSPKFRLGLIAAFTSLFAGSVGLLTNARRAELFGATAAYAAVLVVFVSGNLGEKPGQ